MSEFTTFHNLKDAGVFIAGGGSGIGASLTEGFLERGATITFVQRSDASEFVDKAATKYGRTALFIECDILRIPALKSALQQAKEAQGPIGVVTTG